MTTGLTVSAGEIRESLFEGLTDEQTAAVTSAARRTLVIAGAGSGKTEVMARRIAWWIGLQGVSRDKIIAFTFTRKAAEELKFRIRKWVGKLTPEAEDATLGRMYIGTIHGFCLQVLQELEPDVYGVFDVLDDTARLALVQNWFSGTLGLASLKNALGDGQFETIRKFLLGYDLLHEFDLFRAVGPGGPRPDIGPDESDWIKEWKLESDLGEDETSRAFRTAAGRYYGALHARRLIDFSTAQSELVSMLRSSPARLAKLRDNFTHLFVDEFQDVNPVQDILTRFIIGDRGVFTAVGDHRQAIYGFRGGRVEIMGQWFRELEASADGNVLTLPDNFRSTPRTINLANSWAQRIEPPGGMASPDMRTPRPSLNDHDPSHVALRRYDDRDAEAEWIASMVTRLVDRAAGTGVPHDTRGADARGLGLSDIAVLTRTSTSVRTYVEALESRGIPAVVRAGPDLFQRPEVLLLLCALCVAGDIGTFFSGRPGMNTMASIARDVLGCTPEPVSMVRAAGDVLEAGGLPVTECDIDRLISAASEMRKRLKGSPIDDETVDSLQTSELVAWLRSANPLRRVYPQTMFQWLAAEVGLSRWDALETGRATAAMFHTGQLAALITGLETPGWVRPGDFKWQLIALTNWGSGNARSAEAPLLVPPNAVSILTIHAAKGLEFPVVFLADVAAYRFPSRFAKIPVALPFSGESSRNIDPASLADDNNNNAERRLMYVGLTRAERYLFISSASSRMSRFERELRSLILSVGGQVDPANDPTLLSHIQTKSNPTNRLVTSFSDLRYYLECPHDYYLRKVLGFAPAIDQAFGYGKGVHNLMRGVHLRPTAFAEMASDAVALRDAIQKMIDDGLFYLRYTTGEPLNNMRARAMEVVGDYVVQYQSELATVEFEAERGFETLIEETDVLISGAIDVIRHDDPPRVTIIDFKSGDAEAKNSNVSGLDREQMKLQVLLYGLAARKELEYEPGLGIVRYLGVDSGASKEERELQVPIDAEALSASREAVKELVEDIQARRWNRGPRRGPKKPGNASRCQECDFLLLCGRVEAVEARKRGA